MTSIDLFTTSIVLFLFGLLLTPLATSTPVDIVIPNIIFISSWFPTWSFFLRLQIISQNSPSHHSLYAFLRTFFFLPYLLQLFENFV